MDIKAFFKKPESDSLKTFLGIGVLIVAGFFVMVTAFPRLNFLTGLVNPADTVGATITIMTHPGAQPVEPGLYGVGMAKFVDEITGVANWQTDINPALTDLSPNILRYPTGGLVKYSHIWTDYMTQTLSLDETAALVGGNEIRGNGWIIADRNAEEAHGNEGELGEIVDPLPKYGGLSYLEGFQNLLPGNFIHDFVDIVALTGAKVLYVANLRYATPEEAAQQVKYLVDHGVTIAGVEMDNETYAKGGYYYQSGSPSVKAPLAVTEYLNDSDAFRTAISAQVPGLQYAVVAAPKKGAQETADGFDADTDFNGYWNTALASQMGTHGYSNYVMHFYAPYASCTDEVIAGNQTDIFDCGVTDMRTLRAATAPDTVTTVFPVILDWYASQFPGKKMWLTEWNINQDPTKTDSKYANSILHGIFTENVLTMMNDANVRHNNFITNAIYHTLGTDGGNAMINKRHVGGVLNTESLDIGNFVRRTPFFAFKTMKDIYKGGATPMDTTFVLNDASVNEEDIVMRAYKMPNGSLKLSVTNATNKTIKVTAVTVDGQVLANTSKFSLNFLEGNSNAASRGETEFAINPVDTATTYFQKFKKQSLVTIPAFAAGVASVDPIYEAALGGDGGAIVTPSPDNNPAYSTEIITYATLADGTQLKFDLNTPNGALHPLPLVFFLHGGPFGPGGTNAAEGYIDDFAGNGYAVAEVGYRSTTFGLFPAQLNDLKGAVRYARAHAVELNIDSDKIAVLGTSSGGMLMSLVGTTSGMTTWEGTTGGNAGFSSTPNAVVDLFGSLDPNNIDNLSETVNVTFRTLFGCAALSPCPERNQAAAGNYASAGDPPFLIIHGTEDLSVPYENSVALNTIFQAAGMSSTFITAPGIGHDKDAILTNYMTDIVSFLDVKLYSAVAGGTGTGGTTGGPTSPDCGFLTGLFGGCNYDTPLSAIDTTKPQVFLTFPIVNTSMTGTVNLQARATDNSGVTKVEFYAEPLGLIGEDVTAPYSYLWNTTGVLPGVYYIKAKAYDAAGNSALTEGVKVKK